MPSTSTSPSSSTFPNTSATTANGVTHIDLNFGTAVSKGSGSIFITDGSIQTVIDRATGQPKLRVVGATFTKEIALADVHVSGTHVLFDAAGLPAGHTWQVYMGAGTLLGGGKPMAAITVPGSATFTTPDVVVDPPPPSLTATIALDGNSLKSGAHIDVTITFNKVVESIGDGLLSAGNASISNLYSSDGITWTAILTGLPGKDVASNVVRLDTGSVTAVDGSRGAGVVSSAAYQVDTIVEAWVEAAIYLSGDEGPDDMDGITNDDSISLGGRLYGPLKDGEYIELIINGDPIPVEQIVIQDGYYANQFYWYYSSHDGHFDSGIENTVQVRVVGPNGHSSAGAAKTVVIDTDAPDLVSVHTTPIEAGESISIIFDEKMGFYEHVELYNQIEVVDGFGNTSWIDVDNSMLTNGGKTLLLSAADHNLASGNSYTFYLPDTFTDLAGNQYGTPITITTTGDYEDKAPPRLVEAYVTTERDIYAKGDTLELRLRFSEKVVPDPATAATLVLDLRNGGQATYVGMTSDGKEMRFTYTVGDNQDIEDLDLYTPWELSGHVRDEAGNVMRDVHIEYDSLTAENGYGVAIDTIAPVKPGSPLLHPDSDSGTVGDRITDDATPLLSGSGAEAGAEVSLFVGDVKIGSATADDEGNWNTIVTTSLPAGSYQIRAIQQDRAGNLSPLSDALALTITAAAPAGLGTPVLQEESDSGVSESDGITSDATPELRGTGPASTTLKLLHDGEEVAEVTTNADGVWSYTLPELADGVHNFRVRQGADGPTSAALSVTVDRTRPTVTASPDGASHVNPDGDLVITFSEAIHVDPAEGDSGKLILRDGDNNQILIAREDMSFSADGKTITIAAAAHNMRAGTDYLVTLPATLGDLAGNPMGEYEIAFRTGNDLLPRAFRAEVPGGDHYYRAGETLTIRIRFNETVVKHGDGELYLGLSNNARAEFSGISGNEAVFTYTVEDGDDVEQLTISDRSKLVGQIADLEGNILDNAHIVFSGLSDSAGYGNWIDIDTVAPVKPGVPELHPDSDTGSVGDLLTAARAPRLTGHGAESGARIEIYEGSTLLGYGYADDAGAWEVAVLHENRLSAGVHQLTVRQVDAAGNRSVASDALSITVDHEAELPAAPTLVAGSDSGSLGDGITNDNSPTLSGTVEAFAEVSIYRNSILIGSATADGSGAWTATIGTETALADGSHTFTLTQVDRAGNVSFEGAPLVLTIDTGVPAAPAAPALDAGSDSGSVGDGITNDSTPTLSGTAEAHALIEIYEGATLRGSVTANASGAWSTTLGTALGEGLHDLTVKQTDRAGNVSAASSALALTIDSSAPGAPNAPQLAAASDTGASDNDGITSDTTPTLFGTGAEAGATVVLYSGMSEVGRTVADNSGNWEYTIPNASALVDGNYTFAVQQIDKAGNAGSMSGGRLVVIDTDAPAVTSFGATRALREFQLGFDETIVFRPNGEFSLKESASTLLGFRGNNTGNWYTSSGSGGADSVLNFKISLDGLFNLVMNNDAVQDLAGNVAIVGSPDWSVDLRIPA